MDDIFAVVFTRLRLLHANGKVDQTVKQSKSEGNGNIASVFKGTVSIDVDETEEAKRCKRSQFESISKTKRTLINAVVVAKQPFDFR